MEKAVLAPNYAHIQKKTANRKVIVNTIGLAESTALLAASTCSFLTLIPDPSGATATTMFSLSIGLYNILFI